jgi:hypothetical protein
MQSLKSNLNQYQPWWMRGIRAMSYFSFRYWWFIWLLFILFIFLFLYLCNNICSKQVCNQKGYFVERMKVMNSLLYDCCDCAELEKAVDCPDRELVFQVCNSNMAIDDNFDVFLNEQYIGKLDLSVNEDVGSVFIASLNPDLVISEPDFSCPLSKMRLFRFSPDIVRFGENKLEMKNTRNNGNNNEGSIEIRNYLKKGSGLIDPCKVTDLEYSMGSGSDFVIIFNYTKCCK